MLTGYLGGDAESRTARPNSSEASAFVTLSLATKRTWKDRESGERQSITTWHRCVIFNPRIADLYRFSHEGRARSTGRPDSDARVVAKDGAKKSVTEIRVQRIARLDRQAAAAGNDEAMTTEVAEGAAA